MRAKFRTDSPRAWVLAGLLAFFVSAVIAADTPSSSRAAVPAARALATAAEIHTMHTAMKAGERIMDERVQEMTARAPFVLLGMTQGVYLTGYGAVLTAEVNLVPTANISPFRPAYTAQEIQSVNRQKREKLIALRSGLRKLIVEEAALLAPVPSSERVAIAVSLYNQGWEDTTSLPSQLVLQSQRQPLVELQARHAGLEELQRAIEITEF